MIEQIINWYSNLDDQIQIKIFLALLVVGVPMILFIINELIYKIKRGINLRKTTTQKYREGLIKK